MRIARNLSIVAMLMLVALVSLAPRSCPTCGYDKINTKFDDQAFVMEIVSLRFARENNNVRGIAALTAVDGGETFRSATFEYSFFGTRDEATGLITGKGKFKLKDDPDDVIISARGSLQFTGERTSPGVYDVVGSGRVYEESAESDVSSG